MNEHPASRLVDLASGHPEGLAAALLAVGGIVAGVIHIICGG